MSNRAIARSFGLRAEGFAALWLRLKFFRILARNYAASGGEIDIVARRGRLVVFVEVKARPNFAEAQIAIDSRKAKRITRAARVWLAANPEASACSLRGDALLVAPGRLPRHVPGAYELELCI